MEAGDAENAENKEPSEDESSEIDSLDSQAELKRQAKVKIVTPESEEVGPPVPELTEEELEKLITYVKKITTLFNLEDDDWNQECYDVIKKFFMTTSEPILTVFFNTQKLECLLGFPTVPIYDLTYFLRRPFDILTPENFHENITFGTAEGNVDNTILKTMQYIYAPIFFNMTSWPDSVRNDFCSNLHNFLAKLTDLHYKLSGLTVLYVPYEGINTAIDEAVKDKDLVKRLEAVVVHWTRQIRMCLSDQKQLSNNELLRPKDEYSFWISRYENLAGLSYQFQNKNLKKICEILKATHSSYVHQFLTFVDEIEQNMTEAKSNIEFLQILIEPCESLQAVATPEEIPDKLPFILNLVRIIWKNSPYYNQRAQISALCKYLSNQIILLCINYIDLKSIFAGNTRNGIKMLQTCIACCQTYKQIYFAMAKAHSERSEMPWELSNALIFNHIDSFVKRCNDLIEICRNMIIFGRFDETEEIPKPKFGGTKGEMFEAMCEKVETMFKEYLHHVEKMQDKILDVQALDWHEEMLRFRNRMKSLDIIVTNVTNGMFEQHTNIEECVDTMTALYNYFNRDTLQQLFQGKMDEIYKSFELEIRQVKTELAKEKDEYYAALPYYAGRALLVSLKKSRLGYTKKILDNVPWLTCSFQEDVFAQFDKQIKSNNDIIRDLYEKWLKSLGDDVTDRINRKLLVRSTVKPGLLECNIDRSIMDVCEECLYWEQLEYDIPFAARSVYLKYDRIKVMYEKVMNVVFNYNKIIASLSDEERLLFRQLVYNVDKKIAPGIQKLTWANDVSDEYIVECCKTTEELQEFIDDYKTCNLQIVKICEKICNSPLLTMPIGQVYQLEELDKKIIDYIYKTSEQLVSMYQDIIRYLIVVFEGFESTLNNISESWDNYIRHFDNLVGESIRICIKASLEDAFETLHGDGTTGPNPLLKVEAYLRDVQIDFMPSINEVVRMVGDIRYKLIDSVRELPRLSHKFKVYGERPPPFHAVIEEDAECRDLQTALNNEVITNITMINQYLKTWEPFRDMWEVDKERFIVRYENQNPKAAAFDSNISRYTEVATDVQNEETMSIVHFVLINAQPLKQCIIEHCIAWQQRLCALLCRMTDEKINNIYEYIEVNTELLLHVPENLQELQASMDLYTRLVEDAPTKSGQFDSINDQFLTLDKYEVEVPAVMRKMGEELGLKWQEYLDVLHRAEQMINVSKEKFRAQLLEQADDLKTNARKLLEDFLKNGPFTADWKAKDALAFVANIKERLVELRAQEAQLKKDLSIFNISQPDSKDLLKVEWDVASLQVVWELTNQWDEAWERYKYGEFWKIETEEMEVTAQTLFRKLTRLARELREKGWSIVEHSRLRVDTFRRMLPLIADLKNPAMRPRHWERVKKAINQQFDENSPDFRLEAINDMRMQDYADDISEISKAASMELQIEIGLKNIAEIWRGMLIDVVIYKEGVYRVKSVDDCFSTLEENMVTLSTMKSTRFVEPFAKEVDYWERTLSYIMETLESTLIVQRQWLYLENIFYGEDIRKQLPHESNFFDIITIDWKDITTNMFKAKTALKATHYVPVPNLLKKLNKMNDKLDVIQRELEKYLEMKRHVFPRFYFISNDDMLEILGNAKKPEVVQPHLKKLFDNLNKVKLMKQVVTNKPEAQGMFSEDGEYIEFVHPVSIEGPSESWLISIEKTMRQTLQTILKPCRQALRKNLLTRDKWLLAWCGQLCNTASQIQWTTDCTRTLMQCKIIESKSPLKKLKKKQKRVLAMLSEMSRRDLQKIQRLKVNSLITIEIHAKDVIDKMYKANCMDVTAFEWFSQLRFYWDRDIDNCVIRQTNTLFRYGYEYIGNSGRLVITPLTDRCYITLTTALHLNRGGSPKGPAGTGKTETVKDLGKAMGMWVIVNNCSEGLDYKSMGKMFSGLAQTGAWGCFDEFNRINIEVLSVVAQQILSVLSAIAQKLKVFCLEGQEISLVRTCGIFITMNPGYAGRTELPDNLKSMFRPISMIVPDNLIIAENILFSDGFQMTKILAKKVCTLYQLAMQQLSKQDHYDFGLRSMVALLRYGGRKRRAYPKVPEEEIMYLAMRDMNIAKLTSDDLPLFNGIMSDIFPGLQLPTIDYEDLNTAIENELVALNLQPIKTAITKVIQLYETKNSRHSVMILGKTCTAKTATWKTLKGALGRLKKLGKAGYNYVQEYPLNPKSLALGELYGEYNLSTGEWLDGVLSAIMRKTCSEETPDEKWILFDGPVDAVWIENMNSVMDDNKVLTLINSERITMPEQVSLLFEVGDLSVASPATVSRCGMVYNDYKDWGWRPYVTSWLKTQKLKQFQEMMEGFFDRYLHSILEFKRLNCEEPVPVCELNLVMTFCKLLDIFTTKENGMDPSDHDLFETMGKIWFLFCLVWSVCATVNEAGRKKIDVFIREKEGIFPLKDTVYEYYVDVKNRTFIAWEEKLPKQWQYDPNWPFYKITVPTVDTVRYECILGALMNAGCPALITGPVGTGKTSIAQSVISTLDTLRYCVLAVNMSAQVGDPPRGGRGVQATHC